MIEFLVKVVLSFYALGLFFSIGLPVLFFLFLIGLAIKESVKESRKNKQKRP